MAQQTRIEKFKVLGCAVFRLTLASQRTCWQIDVDDAVGFFFFFK